MLDATVTVAEAAAADAGTPLAVTEPAGKPTLYVPGELPRMITSTRHVPPPAIEPPLNASVREPGFAVAVPPHVELAPSGVLINADGYSVANATPFIASAFGFVILMESVVVLPA